MELTYQSLKDKQRNERDGFSESLSLRVHRALSWLNRAEMSEDDDGGFIFLWIAFNAAYANDTGDQRLDESRRYSEFLKRITDLDTDNILYDILWRQFTNAIRVLLDNHYIYQPFWNYQNKIDGYENWQDSFNKAKKASTLALLNKDTATLLNIIFSRLYALRNQLIHGGATWSGSVNRDQLRDAKTILKSLIPSIIYIMMQSKEEFWADACYPVTDS